MLVSSVVSAGYQYGPFKVTSLRAAADGVYVEFSPAPDACKSGSNYRMHARVKFTEPETENYKAKVSMLLTAYTTGQRFKYIWYYDTAGIANGCSNVGGEVLDLNMFEFENK